jgi:N-methylhydantoinase B
MLALYLYRVDPREGPPFVFIEPVDGGDGARPDSDGPTLVFAGDGNVSSTPIEVLETRYPLRCLRYELHAAVAGPGKHRGGLGVRRDFEILEPGTLLQVVIDNTDDPLARGLHGGRDGAPSEVVVRPGTPEEQVVRWRASAIGPLGPGDIVSVRTGGGGGWGPPLERDPARVLEEVREGLLEPDLAGDLYGVVVRSRDGELEVDGPETAACRAAMAGPAGSAGELPDERVPTASTG